MQIHHSKAIRFHNQAGVASALDGSNIASSRDVGTAAAYSRTINGETLTFIYEDETIKDEQADSVWTIFGKAISGKFQGTSLTPVISVNHFWFSWVAFKPETKVYQP